MAIAIIDMTGFGLTTNTLKLRDFRDSSNLQRSRGKQKRISIQTQWVIPGEPPIETKPKPRLRSPIHSNAKSIWVNQFGTKPPRPSRKKKLGTHVHVPYLNLSKMGIDVGFGIHSARRYLERTIHCTEACESKREKQKKAMRALLQSEPSLINLPSIPLDSTGLFKNVSTRVIPRSAPQTSRVSLFGREYLQTPPSTTRPESLPAYKSSPLFSYHINDNDRLSPLKRVKNPFPNSNLPLRAISASKTTPTRRRSDSAMSISSPIRHEKRLSISEKKVIFIPQDLKLDIIEKKTCSGQHIADIQRWIGGKYRCRAWITNNDERKMLCTKLHAEDLPENVRVNQFFPSFRAYGDAVICKYRTESKNEEYWLLNYDLKQFFDDLKAEKQIFGGICNLDWNTHSVKREIEEIRPKSSDDVKKASAAVKLDFKEKFPVNIPITKTNTSPRQLITKY